jgi:anthranilate synthase component II
MPAKILILDHFDSFTFNLMRLVEPLHTGLVRVVSYDRVSDDDLVWADKVILSPGPGVPADYPKTGNILKHFGPDKPFLGICLGNQVIAETFGGSLNNLANVYHGVRCNVLPVDTDEYLFEGLTLPIQVGLYHSWAVDRATLPPELTVTALSNDGIIMGIRHKRYDIHGLQFHPESYMTPSGRRIMSNWLRYP